MNFYLLLFGMIALRLLGNFYAKLWAIKGGWIFYAVSILFYLVFSSLFILMVKKTSLSITAPLVAISMVAGSVLMGVFYFQEKLTTPQVAGILLSIPVLILLTFPFQILQK